MADEDELEESPHFAFIRDVHFESLSLTNFLSYKSGEIRLNNFVALVGPNASGKSNAIAAIKLLHDIPIHGLPLAIARRGGFDQLRHRSRGRPYDPALRITFRLRNFRRSYYELKLRALQGKRYEVKSETAEVWIGRKTKESFTSDGRVVRWTERVHNPDTDRNEPRNFESRLTPGQSTLTSGGPFVAFLIAEALRSMQTVEINPARVGELQEPSSTREFEPDGSNTASIFDGLSSSNRERLVAELNAVVGAIADIDVSRFADKVTLKFTQEMSNGTKRDFLAKQMSDGTLRAFSILLATVQQPEPNLLVIEEPEVAIHLGALRSLIEILREQNPRQMLISTHSADIIDVLPIESIRVVWSQDGDSHLAPVAEHTKENVRAGLITPGQLLRADALDPDPS